MAEDIPEIDVRINGFFNNRTADELNSLLNEFHDITGIERDPVFEKALFLAQNPDAFNTERDDGLSLTETETKMLELDREPDKPVVSKRGRVFPRFHKTDFGKWSNLPWPMWRLALLCALGGVVQGWDEAAVNGAQIWYQAAFRTYIVVPSDIPGVSPRPNIAGLINSAPYLCCVVSAWFSPWLNSKLGRRGTIFWCALASVVFPLAQSLAQSWQQMLAFRLLLGLGIGPKSTTVPIYAAECSPASIRGSLVMFWQVWTAFGIMAGCIAGVVLQSAGNIMDPAVCPHTDQAALLSWRCSKNWRLILGSPALLPVILAACIYTCVESPRWTIKQGHAFRTDGRTARSKVFYQKAYQSLNKISRDPLLAARDMISQFFLLEKEREEVVKRKDRVPKWGRLKFEAYELLVDRRNSRAFYASLTCVLAQQFCGINFMIYYSNIIFQQISLPIDLTVASTAQILQSTRVALYCTMGFGIINLVGAIPAFFIIDTVGRRTLLLTTFPFLALFNTLTAVGLAVKQYYLAVVAMYLFDIFYSPGEGPVPFVYASESMPIHMREKGMAFQLSTGWLFSWVIAFTGPSFILAFHPAGTFAYYGAWCVLLFFIILFAVPETRLLTLEELDFVFREVKMRTFAGHAWKTMLWHLRLRSERPPRLYEEAETRERQKRRSIFGVFSSDSRLKSSV